jgi:hypothetical protein
MSGRSVTIIAMVILCPPFAWAQQGHTPDVFLLNRASLENARELYTTNRAQVTPAIQLLLKEAEQALRGELISVVQKRQTPPSGDKHDYMSLGPYWWPDTTKPDGLPYIRRDGEVNPEYRLVGDNERIAEMVDNVATLALGYAVSQDERYAMRAVHQLKEWFLNPATKMNPHLEYAQAIKGVNQGRGIGIIEAYSFRHLIDAFIILRQSRSWDSATRNGINAWLESYLQWLLESPNGKDEAEWKNNHGSAYDVQVSCIALYLGKKEIAQRILREVGSKRIAVQIEPDGSQPLELERTKSWGYSNMNLHALIELGILGERVGVDLWGFKTKDGRSIRKAAEFLLPFATGKEKWTWRQIVPLNPDRIYYALKTLAGKLKDAEFAAATRKLANERVQSSRIIFSLPPR